MPAGRPFTSREANDGLERWWNDDVVENDLDAYECRTCRADGEVSDVYIFRWAEALDHFEERHA